MGFLSVYDGSRKVFIDEARGYWVELSDYVSQGEKEEAERCLSRVVMVRGEAVPTPDIARFRQQMVLAAIKSWNLDDDNSAIWPVDLKHVQMLPVALFDKLWDVVDGQNEEMSDEDMRQFHDENLSGSENGDGGASELLDLPAPA